jgi:DNA-binding transcriptional ArsR family regulator/rhodanese-related sulfurtransferase
MAALDAPAPSPDPRAIAAEIAKAVGHPARLEVLERLAQRPHTVTDLATVLRASVTTVSAQLHVLRGAGLVTATREGTSIRYALAAPDVARLVTAVIDTAVRVRADAREALFARLPDGVSIASAAATLDPDAVVVDVRPADEFAQGHIDGAVSIPLEELERRMSELPPDSVVVLYCRGRLCTLSHEGARLLADAGFDARVLATGELERKGASA